LTLIVGLIAAAAAVIVASGCGSSDSGDQVTACKDKSRGLPKLTWGIPSENPNGVVILLPGGGWQPNPGGYRSQVAFAKLIQTGGVATVAVEYGPGRAGFRQIEDVYGQARSCFPDAPVCAIGDSAGGNLALMLATREPELACVIARAAPTDLTSLPAQGGDGAYKFAVDAFGRGGLAQFSPARQAKAIQAPVLLIMAANDPLVPAAQGRELKQALPDAQLLVLPPGPVPFVHGLGVTQSALQEANQREAAFLQQATAN
jgi:acetyl esterase/lipase